MARGRRRLSTVDLSVAQLLNEAQRGTASAHLRYAKMLWELATADAATTRDQLLTAMKWFATVAEPTVYQSRLLNFFGTFANEAGNEDRVAFVEALLGTLVELSFAKDPTARWRFCQLLHAVVGNLPPDAELGDELVEAFEEAMLERLDDVKPTVRAVALRALARLPDPGPAGDFSACELTRAMLDMLAAEKSKVVRKAVLATLPCSDFTRIFFMERTRDEADDVRKMAYMALAERVPLSAMPAADAALLLRRGLTDRAGSVREAVASKLLQGWLEEHEGEPLQLIHALGVQAHPEECELVLKTLLERGDMNAVHLARMAESDGMGLRADFSDPAVLMGPASALLWRVVCEWLSTQAASKGLSAAAKVGAAANIDAAAAAERLEALEAALPATVADMAAIISKHASAGAAYRFSTGQLMQLAAKCQDFADASGRAAASAMLQVLLTNAPSSDNEEEAAAWEAAWHSDAWLRALALFLRKVYGSPVELAVAMLDMLGTLYAAGWTEGAEPSEQAYVHTLGVAGLLLEQLASVRPALAARSAFTLQELLDVVIVRGLRNRSAKVRREAARCLGLYCLLDGIPPPAGHLTQLRLLLITPGESSAVRAVAAQALGDAALARGIKEVDRCQADDLRQAGGLLPGLDPQLQQAPLADLLLEELRQWVDDFRDVVKEASGSRKKAAGRRSRQCEDVETATVLGAALVEALARLVRSHLRCQAKEVAEGRELAMEDIDVVKMLIELVLLYFNPLIEAASLVSQMLPVFFQNYAELTAEHQQFLATAYLPAARLAAANDKDSGKRLTAANCSSVKVMGFLTQLLMTPYGQPGKQEAVGHEMLVDLLLRELLVCAALDVPKPYLAALCRTAASLEVFPVGEAEGGVSARELLEMARQAVPCPRMDAGMRRELASLQERLHSQARQHGLQVEPLSPEEIGGLMDSVRSYEQTGTLLDDFPLPFDELPEPAALPAAGGRAAKTPARGGRRGKAAADSPDSESDEDPGPQMPNSDSDEEEGQERTPARMPPTASRRMPERAARSARKPVLDSPSASSGEEASDDEESSGDEGLPLAENMTPSTRRPCKVPRQSAERDVSAVCQALQENHIS